jgi:hypothetical protein
LPTIKAPNQELSEKADDERRRCRDWLLPFMRDNQPKFLTKNELRAAAMRELNVSKNSFDFAWIEAIECTDDTIGITHCDGVRGRRANRLRPEGIFGSAIVERVTPRSKTQLKSKVLCVDIFDEIEECSHDPLCDIYATKNLNFTWLRQVRAKFT